ncbi:MAG: DNA-binding protein [Oscillospiraceae bacterium]|nr:DNA-binding protein [Oscillospiraceae bacterium]
MERSLDIVILLDIYGELLANSQRQALDLRYNADLSLAEIAEELGGITRQSVVYSIKKGEQRLYELEEKLGIAQRLRTLSGELEQAMELVYALKQEHSDKRFDRLGEILGEIRRGL